MCDETKNSKKASEAQGFKTMKIKAPGSNVEKEQIVPEKSMEIICPECDSTNIEYQHSPISYSIFTCTCKSCGHKFTWDALENKAVDTEQERISHRPFSPNPYPPYPYM